MSGPLRPIVAALEARVRTLDGLLALDGRVYRGREGFAADHDVFPLASLHLGGSRPNAEATSLNVQSVELSVSLLEKADTGAPLDTELDLQGLLVEALFPTAARQDGRDSLDGTCLWLEYDGCVILPRQDGGVICGVRVDLVANYQETLPCA